MAENSPIITVDNLSKRYLVGHETSRRASYSSFRETLMRRAKRLGRNALDMARGRQLLHAEEVEEFWALDNVSFEVSRGEVVGIIGRNGAGKSTLLKILSQITEPTKGRVQIDGRVACLLEVGTGFHPELTGRENIFLNGAILGMRRTEIRAKFDEIVAFAEVERFLDTPVKHYSSGMYVRLAFAVAAHLEPEILVVDEVLAVGDASFQKKSLGKMRDVTQCGRTVLIVSHNMPMVRNLCSRAIVLSGGTVACDGSVSDGIRTHLQILDELGAGALLKDRVDRIGDGRLRFNDACVIGPSGVKNVLHMGEEARIILTFWAPEAIRAFDVSIHINDAWDQTVLRIATRETAAPFNHTGGEGSIICTIPRLTLLSGKYSLLIAASVPPAYEYLDHISQAITFEILGDDVYGTGKIPEFGVFFTTCEWRYISESVSDVMGHGRTAVHSELSY
jgi:homopolymeric O-antigen transport system ATP-binding protein